MPKLTKLEMIKLLLSTGLTPLKIE